MEIFHKGYFPERPKTLVANVVIFGRLLRQAGIGVTLSGLLDTLEGLRYISVTGKDDFKALLMANLISRQEEIEPFERLFDLFWTKGGDTLLVECPAKNGEKELDHDFGKEMDFIFEGFVEESSETQSFREEEGLGWSLVEVDSDLDFGALDQDQVKEVKKAILRWSRKLATRISRRYRRTTRSFSRMDLRRTFRRALRYGGIPFNLVFKARKVKKSKFVLLCDVSGSMDIYSSFFILFMYGLQQALRSSEIFVFSTRLSRVTQFLRAWSLEKALSSLKGKTLNWSGGTDIGSSLNTFYNNYGDLLLHKRTIVIIVSDGWDRGNPEVLEKTLFRIKKRAQKLLWLNPLLASPNYQPLCRGMKTALPFVDLLLPFYNLQSLMRLGRVLEKYVVNPITL